MITFFSCLILHLQTHIFCPLLSVNRSQFINNTTVIHRHIVHLHGIVTTTASNQLYGTIFTEIRQLTALTSLNLRKYDGYLHSFHALFCTYELTYFVLFPPLTHLNSPITPLFIAILSILRDSYYNSA
jgi:hypothetical protein